MNYRKICFWVAALVLFCTTNSFYWDPALMAGDSLKLIVLDAGHGGKDSGCLGKTSMEKNVALSVAKKVRDLVTKNQPGIKVELSRPDDNFIGLNERAQFANKKGADLFISIHCNANNNTTVHGSETYALGLHRAEDHLDVMIKENSSILMEEKHEETYDGFDPKSPEAYIMFKLQQHAYLNQSLALAGKIETQFGKNKTRTSRGVKQAGFLVLWRTAMPAVLIETGFLTNATEEKYLNSQEGQDFIANSVYQAILEYKKTM